MSPTMNAKQISRHLKLNYNTVLTFMNRKMIARKLGKAPNRHGYYQKEKERLGYFNVNAVENWLA